MLDVQLLFKECVLNRVIGSLAPVFLGLHFSGFLIFNALVLLKTFLFPIALFCAALSSANLSRSFFLLSKFSGTSGGPAIRLLLLMMAEATVAEKLEEEQQKRQRGKKRDVALEM